MIRLKQPKLEEGLAAVKQLAKRLPKVKLPRKSLLALMLFGALGFLALVVASWPLLARLLPLFGQAVVVPLWMLVLLSLASLLSLATTFWRFGMRQARAEFYSEGYLSDRILEVDWQWTWQNGSVSASSLLPLCPSCAYELRMETSPHLKHKSFHGDDVILICDNCQYARHFDFGPNDLLGRIVKEIHWRKRSRHQQQKLSKAAPSGRA